MSGKSNIGGHVCGFLLGFIAGLSCIPRGPALHRNPAADPLAATVQGSLQPLEREDEMERARR